MWSDQRRAKVMLCPGFIDNRIYTGCRGRDRWLIEKSWQMDAEYLTVRFGFEYVLMF